ncbi:MAG: SUMF1/EgtB/PvdO family nonheme iron enzyme [Alphaproteobacteria bacterium]|nr:SUMF1/EgtB/PvdO family nonheme iron enzyme [Alphaproteobacteria bacterium]
MTAIQEVGVSVACLLLLQGCPQPVASVCPAGMVPLEGRGGPFCMHAYEVHIEGQLGDADQGVDFPNGSTKVSLSARAGQEPSKGVSWYQAYAACAEAGWHLCTSAEWEDACAGPTGRAWPTLDGAYASGRCAVSHPPQYHKVPLSPSGAFPDCRTPEGVYDLLGNLWEWTDPGQRDAEGRPVIDKRGAAHYSAEPQGCTYSSVGSHDPAFNGTIGFRCCVGR